MILLSSLSELYDQIVTTILYGKKTLILEEILSTILSNEIRERPNQKEQIGSNLVITERNEREEERKVCARQRRVTFIIGKFIRRIIASIGKSGGRRRGKWGGRHSIERCRRH